VNELLHTLIYGGFARMHILYHAAKEQVFGVEIDDGASPPRLRRGCRTL